MPQTPEDIARGRIEKSRREGATVLYLIGLGLTQLPPEIGQLTELTELDLHGNQLTALPPEIGQLTQLTLLSLRGNRLTALPPEIGQLTALTALCLDGNQLTALPPEIGQLTALTLLDLRGNRLSALPPEIGQLTALTQLFLNLNRLTALPPEIGQLTALTSLYLPGNQLTALPPEIGQLTELTELSLADNRLTTLPPEIGLLLKLKNLDLTYQGFEHLPPEIGKLTALKRLILYACYLESLPPEIGKLSRLKHLELGNNPIRELPVELGHCSDKLVIGGLDSIHLSFPPMDVASLGTSAILRYLRAVEQGEETVWESKVLIVGEGAVGKTRLYRALRGDEWVEGAPDTGATVGIEIGPLDLPHLTELDVEMHLKCWDFAGQDVTHATHQFFFSERTLFVVCWNARAGWEAGKLRKWLANIRDRAPHATVLLVATQCDEPHSDYPESELRAEFPQIVATFKTSSKDGDGIVELRWAIAEHAEHLPMMGLRWPESWRAGQQAVAALAAEEPYADLPKVVTVLREHGLEAEDAEVLLRWLHELGEVLFYHDDEDLAGTVMLDPQWVTKRVGLVLASHEVQEAKGVLTRDCLALLWAGTTPAIREHLLRMMERFDLAYRVPDHEADRSLVVERLPQNPPEYEAGWKEWEGQPEVRLRYRLKAMHPGIPTWFIARCHRFSCGFHWLRGVLFQDHAKDARHLALIVANGTERTVDFTVRGAQPWTFLPLLKDGFEDTVTKRYPGLDVGTPRALPRHAEGWEGVRLRVRTGRSRSAALAGGPDGEGIFR